MRGSRRRRPRARCRVGPTLPIGMSRAPAAAAYPRPVRPLASRSAVRRRRCWSGSREIASRTAAASARAMATSAGSGLSVSGRTVASGPRGSVPSYGLHRVPVRRMRRHSRRQTVTNQPASRSGSRILSSCSTHRNQVTCTASAASWRLNRWLRATAQSTGLYLLTRSFHPSGAPCRARSTAATTEPGSTRVVVPSPTGRRGSQIRVTGSPPQAAMDDDANLTAWAEKPPNSRCAMTVRRRRGRAPFAVVRTTPCRRTGDFPCCLPQTGDVLRAGSAASRSTGAGGAGCSAGRLTLSTTRRPPV